MKTRSLSLAALLCGAIAATLPAGAAANVQVGASGWQWGNPLPQGNTIRALSFAGAQGYAAGDFGTLLSTSDGGATWTGLLSGTFTDLTEVQAIDRDSLFAGGGCVARRSDDGGKTFTRVAFTPVESSCPEPLAAAWFVNEKTGYLTVADGTTYRTDDDGQSFAQKTPLPGTRAPGGTATPTDIVFTSESTGLGATSDGKIYRTTDGANSWTVVDDNGRAVRAFFFLDAQTGFAVGDSALFLRTTDGGATWSAKDLGLPSAPKLTSIRCASAQLCVMTTDKGDQLVRTADGGGSATLVTPSADPVFAAAFASPSRVVAAGANGSTAASDDAGLTFAPIGGRLPDTFSRIAAGGGGSVFAMGRNGALARSLDGGRTWTHGSVSTSEDVIGVSFPDPSDGFALDMAGGLFRTADGGATWRTLDTGTTAAPAAVAAIGTKTVLLAGPRGIRRSTDGGETFQAIGGKLVPRAQLSGLDRAGSALFAYGFQSILRSTDGGASWTSIPIAGGFRHYRGHAFPRYGVSRVDFVSAKTGFQLGGGRLWRTTDGGRHWTELPGIGTSSAYGMAFSDARHGYLVTGAFGPARGRAGVLLRTTDGGATWHPQVVVSTPIPDFGIATGANGTDYLLGGPSSLLFTTDGGDAGAPSTLSIATKRTRFTKAVSITVTGRLSPAQGNEQVTVGYRAPGSSIWRSQTVKTASNGSYTTSWRLRKGANLFVAQWAGSYRSAGDGSSVLTVSVGKAR